MKYTKDSVLNQVLLLRKATITQLSEKLAISEISVRHHLIKLEAEGLVSASEERHGVGRPRFVYCLTEKGFQIAPTDYFRLTDQALTTMKHFLGLETFLDLLKQFGRDLAKTYTSSISSENPEQILEEVTESLTRDGFVFPGPDQEKALYSPRITALSITLDKNIPKFVQSITLC
jgi:Predicted transcriptional regulator